MVSNVWHSRTKLAVILWLAMSQSLFGAVAAGPIPAQYQHLYAGLNQILDSAERRLDTLPKAPHQPLIFSTDLLVANSNRGTALLQPRTLESVRLNLDRLKQMGVGCVKFALHYPILLPNFPHASEYLNFYRQVIQEAHTRNLKVLAHLTVTFANTPFSSLQIDFSSLTFEQFKREYRDMVHTVVKELQPDYLGLISEPDTQAKLTGLRELNQPGKVVELIRYVLNGLERGSTLIGAGSGSWSPLTFAEALARRTNLDFIGIHVYPITGPMLANAAKMAAIARKNHKLAFIDEAWLYKTLRPGVASNLAASVNIFRLNSYSFFEPLDQKFMDVMVKLAESENVRLLSFFWSTCFFANLEYSPELDRLSFRELNQRRNLAAARNLRAGHLSSTGQHYREIIKAQTSSW